MFSTKTPSEVDEFVLNMIILRTMLSGAICGHSCGIRIAQSGF